MAKTILIEDMPGAYFLNLPEVKKQWYLGHAVSYWRDKGFPYSKLTKEEIFDEYKKLERVDSSRLIHRSQIKYSPVGLRLANSFHPQIWHTKLYGHTQAPVDHFNNDETLRKLLARAAGLYPNDCCWSGRVVRAILRIHCSGRVANFRPTASKLVIERFSADNARILDFCSGFGGRMLGAITLKRWYTGIDASAQQVSGLRKLHTAIKKFSQGSAEIYHGSAEEIMPAMKAASFDLIFTSPPYFNLEKYSGSKAKQSYIRYPYYADWKENFLERTIEESHRLLKPNGYFIVNVADTKRHPLANDFEGITSKLFRLHARYSLNMSSRPVHKKRGVAYKSEPVYVFRK
jgi:SAM-dependent methyltransferase